MVRVAQPPLRHHQQPVRPGENTGRKFRLGAEWRVSGSTVRESDTDADLSFRVVSPELLIVKVSLCPETVSRFVSLSCCISCIEAGALLPLFLGVGGTDEADLSDPPACFFSLRSVCLPQEGRAAYWQRQARSSALVRTSVAAFECLVSSMEYLDIKLHLVSELLSAPPHYTTVMIHAYYLIVPFSAPTCDFETPESNMDAI